MFFGNSSLEMVYLEAVGNALDAGATKITIRISADSYSQTDTLRILIGDNGEGFTDERYNKFSNLFDVEEKSHKGLGRLVYLYYFKKTSITSFYSDTKKREFDFTATFKEEDAKVTDVEKRHPGSTLEMNGYTLSKLAQHNFIRPEYLKNRLLKEFYSRLYQFKQENKDISITVTSIIDNEKTEEVLKNSDMPQLESVELETKLDLFSKLLLHFSITKVENDQTSLIAAVSVDNRTVKLDIIAKENILIGYSMVFLLYSDWFIGKMNSDRTALEITEPEMKSIQTIFRNKVASIIEERVPTVKKQHEKIQNQLVNRYPHLSGYFQADSIGFASNADILQNAQEQFFKAQKELLDATSLTDEQYEKSIELSARSLTEYILFRQMTIDKLKNSSSQNSEAELHNLFAAMKVQFDKNNASEDLYRNNVWLLDDKYMTYEAVLSDREMSELIKFITEDNGLLRDDDRPDIALVFSNDPDNSKVFDVVMVELKKRGISLEENMKTVTQLEKRARKLMKYYNNKIQRIWYYGIIEFNEEVELALTGEYKELYSSGKMYYREVKVAIQKTPEIILPIGVFIWDIDAVIKDADSRNSAFLNLIKSKFIVSSS